MLNKRFTAVLEKHPHKGSWTYVIWPDSVNFFGTRGIVKEAGARVTVHLKERINSN